MGSPSTRCVPVSTLCYTGGMWADCWEVREALKQVNPDEDLLGFMQVLIDVTDRGWCPPVRDWLLAHDLTLDDLSKLKAMAQDDPVTAAKALILREVDPATAARLLEIPESSIRVLFKDQDPNFQQSVVQLHNAGFTNNEIARDLGCHHGKVGKLLKQLGLRANGIQNNITAEQMQAVVDLRNQGYNGPQISKLLGISQTQVRNTWRRHKDKVNDYQRRSG